MNLDLPSDAEHYVHRAGRTARAGRAGVSVTLCEGAQAFVAGRLEARLAFRFERVRVFDGRLVPDGPADAP